MYRKATLRRMSPEVRELARLTNDLESVLRRLRNRIGKWEVMEGMARAMNERMARVPDLREEESE